MYSREGEKGAASPPLKRFGPIQTFRKEIKKGEKRGEKKKKMKEQRGKDIIKTFI